ncbi:MAG: restriction endonuclease subunit S, partial [Lentisphaeria bacterium]
MFIVAVRERCCIRFMFYWFQASQEQVILLATGGGQPNISQEKIRSVRVPSPPLPEQQVITVFLDRETGRLDTLVAFSGTVKDPDTGAEYTEPAMNVDGVSGKPIGEKQLPERFASPDYNRLLVANKYQTGFDQPLLCAMYVDKRLDGVQAVQTLSRLNRCIPGKEEPFVLDFVNEAEDIYRAFKPYYDATSLQEGSDPHQSEFREKLSGYVRIYAFLSQIMPYTDPALEMLYSFGRLLLPHLPFDREVGRVKIRDEVGLLYYRMQRLHAGAIELREGAPEGVKSPTEVGTGKTVDEPVRLSEIIQVLNARFGTNFTEEDRLFFEQIREK